MLQEQVFIHNRLKNVMCTTKGIHSEVFIKEKTTVILSVTQYSTGEE